MGKGDKPRPLSISKEDFDRKYDEWLKALLKNRKQQKPKT